MLWFQQITCDMYSADLTLWQNQKRQNNNVYMFYISKLWKKKKRQMQKAEHHGLGQIRTSWGTIIFINNNSLNTVPMEVSKLHADWIIHIRILSNQNKLHAKHAFSSISPGQKSCYSWKSSSPTTKIEKEKRGKKPASFQQYRIMYFCIGPPVNVIMWNWRNPVLRHLPGEHTGLGWNKSASPNLSSSK